jgi:hypothetical protein
MPWFYVSTNFDGVNVTGATWTRLDVKLPNQATPWYQFVAAVRLIYHTRKINVAFKYVGSGRNLALTDHF